VAIGALSVQSLNGLAIHVGALAVFALLVRRLDVVRFGVPTNLLLFAAIGLAVVAGVTVVTGHRSSMRRIAHRAREAIAAFDELAHRPARLAELVAGGIAVTLLNVVTLWFALQAFGAGVSFLEVGLVFLVGGAIGNAAPTPGGLGAFEAAVVAALIAGHVAAPVAIAGVLTFRLITFWLPIAPGAWAFAHLRRDGTV
jgi:undecaprenyl-diphosphatase